MKFNYRLLLIFFVLIYSCKKEDINTPEDFLTQAPWKLIRTEYTHFLNNQIDNTYSTYANDVLTFNDNSSVNLTTNFSGPIPLSGKWTLEANKEILTTDLSLNMTVVGYGIVLFYPYCRIIRLNDTELILENTSSEGIYHNYITGISYTTKYVEKSFFSH